MRVPLDMKNVTMRLGLGTLAIERRTHSPAARSVSENHANVKKMHSMFGSQSLSANDVGTIQECAKTRARDGNILRMGKYFSEHACYLLSSSREVPVGAASKQLWHRGRPKYR